jgi:hypothetical protein
MTPGQASAKGEIIQVGYQEYAAHVFDLPNGIAFISHGWADSFGGGGQPCHAMTGAFEETDLQGGGWIALDTPDGDIFLRRYNGPEKPDGPREKAREVLERSLQIKIPPDTIGS